jgi:hypothetical protein
MVRIMRAMLKIVQLAAALWLAGAAADLVAGERKAVVELFTSQGCSSCPPADAYLAELARRDDVLALSFHVDYWNYIGWRDPFSKAQWSKRQRAYGDTLKRRYVYTPQMVIDGAAESVGSKRARVAELIEAALRHDKIAAEITHPDRDTIRIRVPAQPGYAGPEATVWLAFYDRERETAVEAGENDGTTLINTNIVRSMARIGAWRGAAKEWTLPVEAVGGKGRDACAILVQAGGNGRIVGAVTLALH